MKESTDKLCEFIKAEYPVISEKADKEYTRQWGDFTDLEHYSYAWFEALANALNKEMSNEVEQTKYERLFALISKSLLEADEHLKKAIDVAFVENLFWQVPAKKAKNYWVSLPNNLKELYVNFHNKPPL